jgi:hypothetical protein
MKFCPSCGASLTGGAASFCPECGVRLRPGKPSANRKHQKKPATGKRPPMKQSPVKPPQKKQISKPNRRKPSKSPERKPLQRKPNPQDEGYDGYYNDVLPIDHGQIKETSDPGLIKRVALVAGCAFFIVILAVVAMSLL